MFKRPLARFRHACIIGSRPTLQHAPPRRVAERLGHDGTGLLDLSVLTGAAVVHHSPLTVW
jgi:hypothetical protein